MRKTGVFLVPSGSFRMLSVGDPYMVVIIYNPKTWEKDKLGCMKPCLPKP